MFEKIVNGWELKEIPDGLTVVHPICRWKSVTHPQAAELLNNHVIRGMFENDGTLVYVLVKDGQYKLMRITAAEKGSLQISIMDITSICCKLILKGFCNQD